MEEDRSSMGCHHSSAFYKDGLISHATCNRKMYSEWGRYVLNIFIPYCLSNSGGLSVIYPCFSADIALFWR